MATIALKCRFLDHTLSTVEHGEVRIYEGTIVSFQRAGSSDVSPRSMSDLHTLITFTSPEGTEDALTIFFCFHDSLDVGVVCSNAHDVNSAIRVITASKTSSSSSSTPRDFVHMRFDVVEDVSPHLRLRESALYDGSDPAARLPIPFPHTRLDFLRLATNRSVQCKLSSLGDTRLELSCDGVSVTGAMCGDGAGSISLRQARDKLASSVLASAATSKEGGGGSRGGAAAATTTMVMILSDQALYVTENNGRVCSRVALADITELVHMPEASALYIVSSPATTASSSTVSTTSSSSTTAPVVGGSLLVSRFCPDIFTRMSMSGRLVRCLPPQTSMSELQHIAAVGVGIGVGGSAATATPQSRNNNNNYNNNNTNNTTANKNASPEVMAFTSIGRSTGVGGDDHNEDSLVYLRLAKQQQEFEDQHLAALRESRPSTVDFSTQTEADDALIFGGAGGAAPEAQYWMNQAERLQDALARRDVALRLAHQRYEALAASIAAQSAASTAAGSTGGRRGSTTATATAAGSHHHHHHSSATVTMELQRELEVLRHYSRLLEEEILESNEAQLQQRVIELSKELIPVRSSKNKKNNNADRNNNNNNSNSSKVVAADVDDGEAEDGGGTTVQVLRTALLDAQRHQALVTRKCDRLQSELQSVMLNTDAALKELTGFVASLADSMQSSVAGSSTTSVRGAFDIPALVQDVLAELQQGFESKVQSETAVRVAELKALNASLVLELRAREQELERIAIEMASTNSNSNSGKDNNNTSHNNFVVTNRSNVFSETVAQQAHDAKHRSMARQVADLQQVRDRVADELQHIFEGANSQRQLQSLQERVNVLERMHQFPLLINRVASLEAVAAQCEAAKLAAKEMKQDLEDKTAQLSKRSNTNSSLANELDSLRKKVAQLEHAANKEAARREEVEKRAADAATSHQNEVKELRKQVRYHQVRVQELLKRCQQQQQETGAVATATRAESPPPAAAAAAGATVTNAAAPPSTITPAVPAVPAAPPRRSITPPARGTGSKKPPLASSSSGLTKLDQNVVAAGSSAKASSLVAVKSSTATTTVNGKPSNSSSNNSTHGNVKPAGASTTATTNATTLLAPPTSSVTTMTSSPAAATVAANNNAASSPEGFGVVEDPVQVARSRFSEITASRRTSRSQF